MTHPDTGATTLGELRASGHVHRTSRRSSATTCSPGCAAGEHAFPGIVGFDDTVLPELERALLAGHDLVLLGERGQGKTRLIRTLVGLLDEWTPVIDGCEINDHPLRSRHAVRAGGTAAELGDDLPVAGGTAASATARSSRRPTPASATSSATSTRSRWPRAARSATPRRSTSASCRAPTAASSAVNELPDLAERIQVALFNVLEERDIQVRGYALRLPLDLLLVASANPEDYTNRGRIITPLKDRFGAEIRTHYPLERRPTRSPSSRRRPQLVARGAGAPARGRRPVHPRASASRRRSTSAPASPPGSPSPRPRRSPASALRRAALLGRGDAVARVGDLPTSCPTLRGKVEFEADEEGREDEVLDHLLRRAVAETYRVAPRGLDLSGFIGSSTRAPRRDRRPGAGGDLLAQVGPVPGLAQVLDRLGHGDDADRRARSRPRSSSCSRACT